MLCIVFYLNLKLKYVVKYFFYFVVTHGYREYLWILKNYADMGTGMRQIFIQQIGYGVMSVLYPIRPVKMKFNRYYIKIY